MKGGLVLKGRIHWFYHFSFLSQLKARLSSAYQPTRSPEEERHSHITCHVLTRRGATWTGLSSGNSSVFSAGQMQRSRQRCAPGRNLTTVGQ